MHSFRYLSYIVKSLIIVIIVGQVFFISPAVLGKDNSTDNNLCQLAVLLSLGEVKQESCFQGELVTQAIERLKKNDEVKLVNELQVYQMSFVPNDPGYVFQESYLQQIHLPEIWDKPQVETVRPVIAVIDSGVDIDNPDLKNNIWFNPWEIAGDKVDNDGNGYIDDINGWDFVKAVADPRPKFETDWTELAMHHGTVVAGVAAALGNNAEGVTGVAWRSRIMPLRVLDSKGKGDTVKVARAINYAIANHADIINLSFIGQYSDPILEDAITRAWQAGILVVAASGNEAETSVNLDKRPQYPVCDNGLAGENHVIGVAAVDENDKLASFSNYGASCVDIAAPGTKIFSSQFKYAGNGLFSEAYGGWWSGTSVAAPLVSGALALLKAAYPRYTNAQLRDLIIASSDSINDKNPGYFGLVGGRLNIASAFDLASRVKFITRSPLLVAPQTKEQPLVKIFNSFGEQINSFLAYHPKFTGGVNLASGDIDGNGQVEIITVPKGGGGPHVRIFTQSGQLVNEFMAFLDVYRGGLSVAVADFNNDKKDDIVVATGKKITGTVRVFDGNGQLVSQFFPYEERYTGGVNVTVGDVDGDGINEIITSPQTVGKWPIRIFTRNGYKKYELRPLGKNFTGIINMAAGDVNSDGLDELVIAPASGQPQISIVDYKGKILGKFMAFAKTFRGGVNVTVGDVDGDRVKEIIAAPQTGGGPQVIVFDSIGKIKAQFMVYDKTFRGGLSIAAFR